MARRKRVRAELASHVPLPASGRGGRERECARAAPQCLCGCGWVGSIQEYLFRLLNRCNVQVDRNRLAVAAHQDTFQRLGLPGVDFLVRHVGRYIDEVARAGLGGELEVVTPAPVGAALDHIDHAFERAVVVGAGLGVGVDGHRAGPQFLGADPGEIDARRGSCPASGRCWSSGSAGRPARHHVSSRSCLPSKAATSPRQDGGAKIVS